MKHLAKKKYYAINQFSSQFIPSFTFMYSIFGIFFKVRMRVQRIGSRFHNFGISIEFAEQHVYLFIGFLFYTYN